MSVCKDETGEVALRNIWPNESLDFTPWLAKNLRLLGDSLGLKLEWIQSEVPIGPYFLDILARETDEDVKVAIENQLEETNLHHLGQLLTYATGCGAHIAIWVAPEFGYEHAQALHLLNEWTNDRIRFYGVKIEFVKKAGVQCPEPGFREVVYPGGWNKKATLPSGEMSLTKRRHHEFFQPLTTELRGVGFVDRPVNHFDHTGRRFPSGIHAGISYAVSFYHNSAWVSLHIQMEDKERTKQVFDALNVDRKQIEKSFGAVPDSNWTWKRHDSFSFSSINVGRDGSIDDPPEKLEATRAWMLEHLPKLKKVFDPHLNKVLDIK